MDQMLIFGAGCSSVSAPRRVGLASIQASLYGICGGQSGTGTDFCRSASAVPCQYHPTYAARCIDSQHLIKTMLLT